MKVKPFREEIILLALDFIEKELGEAAIAAQLRSKHASQIPEWVVNSNLLLKKGLSKSIKAYLQMDKKLKKYYSERKQEAEEQDQQESEEVEEQTKPKKLRKKSAASVEKAAEAVSLKQKSKKISSGFEKREHHENTSKWVMSTFEAPKKLDEIDKEEHKDVVYHHENIKKTMISQPQEIDENSEEQIEKKRKKSKSKKNKAKQATIKFQESSEQESSEEEEPKPRKKSKGKKQIKKEKQAVKKVIQKQEQESEEEVATKKQAVKKNFEVSKHTRSHDDSQKTYGKSFSRINPDEVGFIPENLRDNTFEAKFKYGKGGDEWGKFGYQKLKDTRGDSFKKTKGKLKNRAFQGANIDFNAVNSIAL